VRPADFRLTTSLSAPRIAPGGEERLRLAFKPRDYEEGPVATQAVLYTNDPDQQVVKFRIDATINSPLNWDPKIPPFREIRPDNPGSFLDVRVSRKDGKPVGPLRVTPPVAFVRAETSISPSGETMVHLALVPPAPMGVMLGWIKVETKDPVQPVFQVPIRAFVVGDLKAGRPPLINFGWIEEGQPATGTLSIVNTGTRDVHVTRVEPHLPVKADVSVTSLGKRHEIELRLPAPSGLHDLAGYVNVFTDHPSEPVVRITTQGWVVPKNPASYLEEGAADLSNLVRTELTYMSDENFAPKGFVNRFFGDRRDDRVSSFVADLAKDANWRVRQRAVQMLAVLGGPRALEILRPAVTDDVDEDVRRFAAMGLAEMAASDALPTVTLALQDNDDWVRDDAARVLGDMGDPRAIPALTRALDDEDSDVRATAAESLKRLKGQGTEPR
jgi:hypothetical protein